MTWLFISAIALGVVVAVAVTSYQSPFDEKQAEERSNPTARAGSTINDEDEHSMSKSRMDTT